MNTTLPVTTPADKLADGAWPGQNDRVLVPQTSLLPGTEGAPAPAVELLHRAAQGAHHTIDRLVDGAAPTVQQLSDRVSSTEASLQARAHRMRQAGDAWTEQLRGTVRGNPLLAMAGAVVLGALVAQITRSRR
jgi:hypothetical protein